jgi:hypothetical protein
VLANGMGSFEMPGIRAEATRLAPLLPVLRGQSHRTCGNGSCARELAGPSLLGTSLDFVPSRKSSCAYSFYILLKQLCDLSLLTRRVSHRGTKADNSGSG